MNKKETIELLNHEGWTKADAERALESIDFKSNTDIDELMVRRATSQFAGAELIKRQNLQRAQKGMVTKRNKEIKLYIDEIQELTIKIEELMLEISSSKNGNTAKLDKQVKELKGKISKLVQANDELNKANSILQKDNRSLKNIVDEIRFKLTVEFKDILRLDNISQIRKRLMNLLKSTLG